MTHKNILTGIGALIVGLLIGMVISGGGPSVGGTTNFDDLGLDSITVSGASTLTGAVTASGALTVSGQTALQELTQSGGILATSTTATAGTLTEAEMLTYNYIAFTANTGNTALTLPATSTMTTLLPNAGDMREWIFENATTTAATTLTITAGAGIDLQGVSNATDVLDGTEWAELRCIRKTNTDVMCIVSELEDAD